MFCAVVAGREPAHLVLADEAAVAFLDRRPLFPGHVLVVPRAHHRTLTDLPATEVGPFFLRVRRVAAAVEQALDAAGSFVAANNRISQSVPHLHVHVVPRNPKDGLRGFFWPRRHYPDEETAAAVAQRLRTALGVPEPDASEPGASEPGASGTGASEPGASGTGASGTGASEPGASPD